MSKLFEAFKAISSMGLGESTMNEKAFEADKEGIEEMEKFVDVDENGTDDNDFSLRKFDDLDEVEVFDDKAPFEEEKPEDHTGQAILECSICHSNIFRKKDEVEVNEEGTLADEGKECPYCGNPDGYYVVGMVEPFTTGEEKEETEEETEVEDGDEKVEVKEKEEVEESLTESKECDGEECEDESCKEKNEAFPILPALAGAAVGAIGTKLLSDELDPREAKKKGAVVEAAKARHLCKDNLTEAPVYGLEPQYDSRKSFYGKAQVDTDGDRQTLYSYNTKVAEIKDGNVKLFPAWNYSATTLRHIKDFLRQNGFRADSSKQISADYEVVEECLKEDTQAANVVDKYQEWVDYDMKKYGKISNITKGKLDKAGFEVVKDDHGDYEVIAKDKKELGESFEKVEVETDSDRIKVETEGEKVKVETEPKTEQAEEEVVAEVTDEEADQMVDGEEGPDEEDIDVSEFDEETFDTANESYLKENYSNVRSYKTTSMREAEGKLVVEGLITFKSGAKKKTQFIYESHSKKGNKLKFIGENKQIASGKKAFRLNASLKDGRVITESLNYRYTVKQDGKSAVVSGTARAKRK